MVWTTNLRSRLCSLLASGVPLVTKFLPKFGSVFSDLLIQNIQIKLRDRYQASNLVHFSSSSEWLLELIAINSRIMNHLLVLIKDMF